MRDRRGPARASSGWGAARLAWTFRWERAAHGRPLPPIGEELRSMSYMWDALRQDLAFGVRMLRRQPGFTVVAVIALALGIGANTAIFSVVDAVLWRSLPYPGADQIVSVGEQRPREGRLWSGEPADFDWRRRRSFPAMAAPDWSASPAPASLGGCGVAGLARFLDELGSIRRRGATSGSRKALAASVCTEGFWRRRSAPIPPYRPR
jgi:hypothetical protein